MTDGTPLNLRREEGEGVGPSAVTNNVDINQEHLSYIAASTHHGQCCFLAKISWNRSTAAAAL